MLAMELKETSPVRCKVGVLYIQLGSMSLIWKGRTSVNTQGWLFSSLFFFKELTRVCIAWATVTNNAVLALVKSIIGFSVPAFLGGGGGLLRKWLLEYLWVITLIRVMSVTYKRQTPLVILTGKHERIFFSVLSCVRQMDFFHPVMLWFETKRRTQRCTGGGALLYTRREIHPSLLMHPVVKKIK